MRRLGHILLVVALSFSIGFPRAILQSAAWVNMVVTYSQETNLADALEMTFDGQHPCRICKKLQQTPASKSQQAKVARFGKVVLFYEATDLCFVSTPISLERIEFSDEPIRRDTEPAVPPPRWA